MVWNGNSRSHNFQTKATNTEANMNHYLVMLTYLAYFFVGIFALSVSYLAGITITTVATAGLRKNFSLTAKELLEGLTSGVIAYFLIRIIFQYFYHEPNISVILVTIIEVFLFNTITGLLDRKLYSNSFTSIGFFASVFAFFLIFSPISIEFIKFML